MNETVVHIPQLTDTLVTLGNGEQKEDHFEDESEDSEGFDLEDTVSMLCLFVFLLCLFFLLLLPIAHTVGTTNG